ncbi:MAG: TlpA family protein disulfide reductase [Fimbriimonas sp.]
MRMLNWKRAAAFVCFTTMLVVTAPAQGGPSGAQSADAMLAAIAGVKPPTITQAEVSDPEKVKAYRAAYEKANKDRADLILAFYKAYPTHADTPKLLQQRWATLLPPVSPLPKEAADAARADVNAILAGGASEEVTKAGKYFLAQIGMREAGRDVAKMTEAADEFIKAFPADPRGASLLNQVAGSTPDPKARLTVYERIVKEYPNAPGAKYAPGKLRQAKELGKPLALSFTDAITGKKIDVADLKGKVVVLDFWAVWCGPCVAELPKMKKLYADYKDKGLEIIGISLDYPEDKGGLKMLKDFVAEKEMAWPQYYQGKHWDGDYSVSWGINSIPALFLIDKNGNLVDVEARSGLEERVKALLEQK